MKLQPVLCAIALSLIACSTAAAHPHHGGGGFLAGFSHPWLGLDHLLAAVAVGLLGAQMGGRARWLLPASFLLAMLAGGAVGATALGLGGYGIALSVVSLGAALMVAGRYPLIVAAAVVGAFGLLHGHAHGLEAASLSAAAIYSAGFVSATALLHLAGVAGGLCVLNGLKSAAALRLLGAGISFAGLLLLLQV